MEAEIGLEILSDLANEALERSFADQKVGGLLVFANLTEGYGSWTVTVRLFDTSGGRGRLAGCLGGKLLAGSLSSG